MFPEKYVSRMGNKRLLIYNKENLEQYLQSTPIKEGKFDFNDTMTSLSEKLLSSVIESASGNENHNSSCSDKKSSSIKRKRKGRYMQPLCAEQLFDEQPPESYDRKLDTDENGRNNEPDDTEKSYEKVGEKEQYIHLQIDSKKKATMFYPLKVVKEVMAIESHDE